MEITIPTQVFRPFAEKRLKYVKGELTYYENKISKAVNEYEQELKVYEASNWLKKLFKSKPEHPSKGFLTPYDSWQLSKSSMEIQADYVSQVLSTLDHSDEITLTKEDISYFNVLISIEHIKEA
ncbi:hypothetical protein C2I27_03600 [Priestia megaterium]|uniref:hypothetical protein n=1 Tax=Priestia megaterium TaxID=1404 RepID=UPI000D509F89|nr:hypothetical protein [Priestia megaterium]PVC74984.1 hypothetical protein C2I27_03600 [Priestia megaterium]